MNHGGFHDRLLCGSHRAGHCGAVTVKNQLLGSALSLVGRQLWGRTSTQQLNLTQVRSQWEEAGSLSQLVCPFVWNASLPPGHLNLPLMSPLERPSWAAPPCKVALPPVTLQHISLFIFLNGLYHYLKWTFESLSGFPTPLYNVHSMRTSPCSFHWGLQTGRHSGMNCPNKNVTMFSGGNSPMQSVLGCDLVERKGCRNEAAKK